MKAKPLIILTNDDGIHSPGLIALVRAVQPLGELLIVAPRHQQTAMSRSYLHHVGQTEHHTLHVNGVSLAGYAIEATPAQAVRHGLARFAPRLPDLLISGINYGENIGSGTTVSGTVGAAWEGAAAGIPSLAVSLEVDPVHHYEHSEAVDFTPAAYHTRKFAEAVLTHGLPPGVQMLNINLPERATTHTPWRLTRVSGYSHYHSIIETNEQGEKIIKGYQRNIEWERVIADSDIYAVFKDKVISVSPISIDITAHTNWRDLQQHLPVSLAQIVPHPRAPFQADNAAPTKILPALEPNELRRLSRKYGKPRRVIVQLPGPPLDVPLSSASRIANSAKRRAEVIMAIRLRDGRFLLHTKVEYPRRVMRFPSGGVHPDETVEDALWRELAEETGLSVNATKFAALIAYEVAGVRDPFVSYVFLIDSAGLKPRVQDISEQIAGFQTVAPSRLRAIAQRLRSLSPDWRNWGEFRAASHEVVADVLKE